jgi:ribonuclease HI
MKDVYEKNATEHTFASCFICCAICGMGDEDAHHATVRCTKAAALRSAMRERWCLPDEKHFAYTGRDWLQLLLGQVDEITKARILLLLWRAWYLRNDIIHNQGKETIQRSVIFLESYDTAQITPEPAPQDRKGKEPMRLSSQVSSGSKKREKSANPCWQPPEEGWIKLNTDAAFCKKDSTGGAGAVARDHKGTVVLAACSPIQKCHSAEQAEAIAALRGLKLLEGTHHEKILLESDSSAVVAALRSPEPDRSLLWSTFDEAKQILKGKGDSRIVHTRRENNRVADGLAAIARSAGSCIWTADVPDHITYLVMEDCNHCTHTVM